MDIVNSSPSGGTGFYAVFAKKTLWSHQPIVIDKDVDGFYTVPNHGTRIFKLWIENWTGDVFEVFVGDTLVWRWSAEYLAIHWALRNPASKTIPNVTMLPVPEFFPVILGTKFRMTGTGTLKADWIYDTLPIDGDYHITQVQYQAEPGILGFRNVVKELIFVADVLEKLELDFNSVPKFKDTGDYFQYIQPSVYHTGNPLGVFTYSFCLRPEDDMPSGGVNFSRIQYVTLKGSGYTYLRTYALSLNTLRVRGNDASLLFDNL